jgi:peroxiredoxin (alkyl hydroperoxide reductase subunit C)
MAENPDGCVTPSRGPITTPPENPILTENHTKEVPVQQARVGKPAPDFELSAFIAGGFKNIKLSDFKGKWIVVCFYPGDFTFV